MTPEEAVERERRLYWLKSGDENTLVFDPGHYGGDVHIYRHEKSTKASDIRRELLESLGVEKLPAAMERDFVMFWAERHGLQLAWTVGGGPE